MKLRFVVGSIASNVDIIYKTTNGGGSWSSVQNLAYQNLNCVAFADSMHGAAGGSKGDLSIILQIREYLGKQQQEVISINQL